MEIHVLQGEREMAADNRTLGRFHLEGIPPAPRGVPQIEVTFDIDANGILNVSAKDLATGKEQKVTITASSGLTKEEVDRMVKEAQEHAEEDRRKRELVDTRNQLDSLIYSTEKTFNEHKDKLSETDRKALEEAIGEGKKALAGQDINEMKRAMERITQASHKMAEFLYQRAGTGKAASGEGKDVVEGEVVDEDKKEGEQ